MAIKGTTSDDTSVVQYKRSQGQQVCDKLKTVTKPKRVPFEDTAEQGTVAFNNYLYHSKIIPNHENVKPADDFQIELPTSHRIIQFATPTSFDDKQIQTDPIDPFSKEILKQADSFKDTEDGHLISEQVAELNLREVPQHIFDTFVDRIPATLRNIRGRPGFNATTLGAIFFCLGQVTKKALENYAIQEAKKYIRWCFSYVERTLSLLVQQHGGYEAILGIAFWKTVRKCCLSLGIVSVAAGGLYYIWKN